MRDLYREQLAQQNNERRASDEDQATKIDGPNSGSNESLDSEPKGSNVERADSQRL